MDIVEFVEKVCGIKLLEYQKQLLREFVKLSPNERQNIVYGRKGTIRVMPGRCQGKRATMLIFDDYMGEAKDDSLK